MPKSLLMLPMPGARELENRIREYESLLVGYSGGVDSALVAVTACQTLGPTRVVAALGVSASLSTEQYDQAHDVARCFAIPLVEVATDEGNGEATDTRATAATCRPRCRIRRPRRGGRGIRWEECRVIE